MKTDHATYQLANGETLVVRTLEPPLGDYIPKIEYWWRDVREPLVRGELAATSIDRFVVGELDGEYVGSMTYSLPRDTRDLSVLGMVWTRPDHRRKGIGEVILSHLLEDFRAQGGVAMYLCTTNPYAYDMYHKAGFRSLVGDGMRYLTPGHEDFDRTFFAYAGEAVVRPGTWGDLPRVSALYNQPEPDWLIKDYPRRVFRDMRYESHYIRAWKPASEGRGVVRVLENPAGRVVGIASAIEVDSFYEQHALTLEVWACPAYLGQVPALLEPTLQGAANDPNTEIVQAWVAACDQQKVDILAEAGFREEARLRDHLAVGDERVDLLLYRRHLGRRQPAAHPLSEYYGAMNKGE